MMIGTVMMSSSSQNGQISSQSTETASLSKQQGNNQISTISQMVTNGQEYVSDTDASERGGRSSRNNGTYSSRSGRHNKNGQYVLNGNNLTYDTQSVSSQNAKNRSNNQNENYMTNSQYQTRQSSNNNSLNKNRNQIYSSNNMSMNNRKISERSVNFDEENYSKLKTNQQQQQLDTTTTSTKLHQNGNTNNNSSKMRETKRDYSHYGQHDQQKPQDDYDTVPNKQQIQVQILPQDDNWGENTTAFTADFSDFNDDMTEDGRSYIGANGTTNGARLNSYKDSRNQNVFIDIDEKQLLKEQQNNNCCCNLFKMISFCLTNYFSFLIAFLVSFCSFVTPIMFIILPRLNLNQQWQVSECGLECEGLLIGIAFKLFILLLGSWAIFLRKPRTSLPRIYELRALLIFLLCIMTFSYWLFYSVRIIDTHQQDYHKILQFSVSYVDVLLFIYIISVFILELRQLKPEYVVKIVRSPDGEESEYLIGKMSIQRAAIYLLEQYYKDFNVYNPWIENAHRKRTAQLLQLEQQQTSSNKKSRSRSGSVANFNPSDDKNKDLDDDRESRIISNRNKSSRSNLTGGNLNANDRFYEEYEYDRRLRKRRARLLTSTEEAFLHIKRIDESTFINANNDITNNTSSDIKSSMNNVNGNAAITIMDPYEAAQAVFTSIARDLRRYLRVTRQQPFYTRDSIIQHLANCLSYDMSPKSFLQRYLNAEKLIFNDRALINASALQNHKLSTVIHNITNSTSKLDQSWILICDIALYQNVEDNLMLVLKQNEVSLMCTFKRLPRFNLIEDILDPKRNKFVLKLNSETTV